MKITKMYKAGDVRIVEALEPAIQDQTDAVVRITRSCICGSDLHPYRTMDEVEGGVPMGHEFIGIVEKIGSEVTTLKEGDFVIAPFAISDGICEFCKDGLQTSCVHGSFWATGEIGGGQAEAVRVPLADGTLVKVPGKVDESLYASLLTLSDVFGTGYHAALKGGVNKDTTVAVVGDGAVGLMAVLSAKRFGATKIILMGRHKARTDLGIEYGASDVVAERGEEGIEKVMELTNGVGVNVVLECVGYREAYDQSVAIVRPGGTISRVGVPQYEEAPVGFESLFGKNITLTGGPAPVRAYIEELLPDVLSGKINPGKVFDKTIGLNEVPQGYEAMNNRTALKVMIDPSK